MINEDIDTLQYIINEFESRHRAAVEVAVATAHAASNRARVWAEAAEYVRLVRAGATANVQDEER